MISRPLLTRVELSIVTLGPISQFGCLSASAAVIEPSSSVFFPLNGPPDAVRRIFSISSCPPALSDWNMAECSESTGRILTPCFFASGIITCPAHTRVSLFASAMSCPASIAAIVGFMPIMPTIAPTTISASGRAAASISPSIPDSTLQPVSETLAFRVSAAFSSYSTATSGSNSLICASSILALCPAATAVTLSLSLFPRTISSVCVPIEPVEPSITIFFIGTPARVYKLSEP